MGTMRFGHSYLVPKAWGTEEVFANGIYCGKILRLNSGHRSSLHKHREKDETFYVLSGRLTLEVGGLKKVVVSGETIRVGPGVWHRFWASTEESAVLIEVSTHHSDDDVERREPSA